MDHVIGYLKDHWDEILVIANTFFILCSLVAKLTPNKTDDMVIGKIIDFFSLGKKK